MKKQFELYTIPSQSSPQELLQASLEVMRDLITQHAIVPPESVINNSEDTTTNKEDASMDERGELTLELYNAMKKSTGKLSGKVKALCELMCIASETTKHNDEFCNIRDDVVTVMGDFVNWYKEDGVARPDTPKWDAGIDIFARCEVLRERFTTMGICIPAPKPVVTPTDAGTSNTTVNTVDLKKICGGADLRSAVQTTNKGRMRDIVLDTIATCDVIFPLPRSNDPDDITITLDGEIINDLLATAPVNEEVAAARKFVGKVANDYLRLYYSGSKDKRVAASIFTRCETFAARHTTPNDNETSPSKALVPSIINKLGRIRSAVHVPSGASRLGARCCNSIARKAAKLAAKLQTE